MSVCYNFMASFWLWKVVMKHDPCCRAWSILVQRQLFRFFASSSKELEVVGVLWGLYGKNVDFQEQVNVSSSSRVKSSVMRVFGVEKSFASIIFHAWVGPGSRNFVFFSIFSLQKRGIHKKSQFLNYKNAKFI